MKYRLVSIYLQIVGDYSMYELGWILKKSYNSGMELLMHLKFGTLVVSTLWPAKNIFIWMFNSLITIWKYPHTLPMDNP